MGCWQETCALTLTPIYETDEVVCLSFAEEVLTDSRRIFSPCDCALAYLKDIQFGTYDDYGYINESEYKRPENTVFIFLHKKAWEFLVKTGLNENDSAVLSYHNYIYESKEFWYSLATSKFSEEVLNKIKPELILNFLYAIRWLCLFRRELWMPSIYTGSQEIMCTKKLQKQLYKITGEIISKLPRD